jgi:hypothetical protein
VFRPTTASCCETALLDVFVVTTRSLVLDPALLPALHLLLPCLDQLPLIVDVRLTQELQLLACKVRCSFNNLAAFRKRQRAASSERSESKKRKRRDSGKRVNCGCSS